MFRSLFEIFRLVIIFFFLGQLTSFFFPFQVTVHFTMDKTISYFLKKSSQHPTTKSHKTAAIHYLSLKLIFICFNLRWHRLFCLESIFLAKFIFCEIALLHPLFWPTKRLKMKFCKTIKITIGRPSHFDRSPVFCIHYSLWSFSPFGQFFGPNS